MSDTKDVKHETGYQAHCFYNCIDAYKETETPWTKCPCCGLHPRVWIFDNGRSTSCGCWQDTYNIFSVYAESVMSVHERTDGKNMLLYDPDGLRNNWEHWCETGVLLFEREGRRADGRW